MSDPNLDAGASPWREARRRLRQLLVPRRPATSKAGPERRVPPSGAAGLRGPTLTIDLRRFPIGRRNEPVFRAFEQLRDGFEIVVLTDRDPHGLIADMTYAYGSGFDRTALHADAALWRLRIGRAGARAGAAEAIENLVPTRGFEPRTY